MADTVNAALSVIEKVLHIMNEQANLYATLEAEVKAIQIWLQMMQAYLADMDQDENSGVLKVRVNQVQDVAHHIEDAIDELMYCVPQRYSSNIISEKARKVSRAVKVWNPLSSIQGMKTKFKNIRKEINDIITIDKLCETTRVRSVREEASGSGLFMGQHMAPYAIDDCEIVGFNKQKKEILSYLKEDRAASATSSRNMVTTISVVGSPGSGKTALVKHAFKNCKEERLFDCYAWVQVSQSLKLNELLQRILIQFSECDSESVLSAQSVTQMKLASYMMQRKYLLVLDDIWSIEDWMGIVNNFPAYFGVSGSRIIVITRNSEVASLCANPRHYCVNLDGRLDESEAWVLFCKYAFPINGGNYCPPELMPWSEKILKKCEGLPSAIVDIGTHLSTKQDNQLSEWEKVHESLEKSDLPLASKVLHPSYKNLPSYLRSCFLYFSIFPREWSIERGRLIRLWIAEGFVLERNGRSLEEVAERYLSELIGRNLVRVSTWDFDKRERYCRVHSHVYDFIIYKCKEVNFISILSEGSNTSGGNKFRRLSLQDDFNSSWLQDKDLSFVRSAFFFKRAIISHSVIDIFGKFMLLRVLDLRDAPLTEFPKVIVSLVLLRYLCLRNTRIKKLPGAIKKLSHLETLDLKKTDVTQLPQKISLLRNLRHLLVYRCNTGNHVDWDLVKGVELFEGIGLLKSLQKLLLVKPVKDQKVLTELGNLVQLRKLGLIGLKPEGGKDLCTSIEKMKVLSTLDISSTTKEEVLDLDYIKILPPELQRLYLNGRLVELPSWIPFLGSLLKISLKWSRLRNTSFEALQTLPNLIELEMVAAFDGEMLVFKSGSFKKLKILHIERFDQLSFVVIEEGSIFELQKMSLSGCMNLQMLPWGINTLASLRELHLYGMSQEFVNRLEHNRVEREKISHIPVINNFVHGVDGSWVLERNI